MFKPKSNETGGKYQHFLFHWHWSRYQIQIDYDLFNFCMINQHFLILSGLDSVQRRINELIGGGDDAITSWSDSYVAYSRGIGANLDCIQSNDTRCRQYQGGVWSVCTQYVDE